MKLRTNHVFIKAHCHQRPFIGNMRPFFFYTKNAGAHLPETVVVGLYYLVIAAVNRKKRILQTSKYRFFFCIRQNMYWKNAKGSRISFGNMRNIIMPACQLVGMADKKYKFLLQVGLIVIPFFNC